MARPLRVEFADAVHHVTARAPSSRVLFADSRDRRFYLRLLAREVARRRWQLFSYCQMTNHVHLLLRTPAPDLGAGIKAMHEQFAGYVNRSRDEHGAVFGARFHNRLVQDDRHFLGCLRYIARNPVEAGMCGRAADWHWSAHRALTGDGRAPDFLDVEGALEALGGAREAARTAYRGLVAKTADDVIAELRDPADDAWMVEAADAYAIEPPRLAEHLGISRASIYRRLAAAREQRLVLPTGGRGACT